MVNWLRKTRSWRKGYLMANENKVESNMKKIIYIRTNIGRGFMDHAEKFCEENEYIARWVKDPDINNPLIGGISIGFLSTNEREDQKHREKIHTFAWSMSRDPFPKGHMFPEDVEHLMNHYVIGDVHGHYEALVRLIDQIPKGADIIFVGDLIDRGEHSAEIVKLIRKNRYRCVMGNHEQLMFHHGQDVIESIIKGDKYIDIAPKWEEKGAMATLLSYHLISDRDLEGRFVVADDALAYIEQFKDDMQWMMSLPRYIELWNKDELGRSVVISHAAVDKVWDMRKEVSQLKQFDDAALYNRNVPDDASPIFNIFGHTPQPGSIKIEEHYINVDTGAYKTDDPEYGKLSAYCIETGKVISVGV